MTDFGLNYFQCFYLLYRVFQQTFSGEFGPGYGDGMMVKLEERITKMNTGFGEKCISLKKITENEYAIAICTPTMKRINTLWDRSGEMVLIDSSGNMDRHGVRVFLMLTYSPVGGLPVGVLITTSETEEVVQQGLELYLTLLPEDAFGGRGMKGPKLFMTDDCAASRNALHTVFPSASLYLCVFHVLQAVWRYLLDSKHGVGMADRQEIFYIVKEMLWADDQETLESVYSKLVLHCSDKDYSCLLKYFNDLYERRKEWGLCYREFSADNGYSLVRANNTNNICEAAVRVLKEKILKRVQAFNVVQLLDFLCDPYSSYYVGKLLDAANGKFEDYTLSTRFYPDAKDISPDMVQEVS